MTPEEFAAARATLGLGIEDVAADFNVPPHSVEAMESGAIRVPSRIGKDLAFRAALRERQRTLETSGLPECPTAAALERVASGEKGESALALLEKLNAHSASCPECRARSEYVERHGPALPDYPMPEWIQAIGWMDRGLNRLPEFLRPPRGDDGEGRRVGVFAAAAFSVLALGLAAFALISGALNHASEPGWWWDPIRIAVFLPIAYFVGFFLAGWGFDATRGIRRLFIGYVIRGAVGAAAVYGTMGVMLPAIDKSEDWHDLHILVPLFALLGAVGGGVLWVVHRVQGKLPAP
jgi:hypothetical protein